MLKTQPQQTMKNRFVSPRCCCYCVSRATFLSIISIGMIVVCLISSYRNNTAILISLLQRQNQDELSIVVLRATKPVALDNNMNRISHTSNSNDVIRPPQPDDRTNFFRYSQLRHNHDAILSHQFLSQELHHIMQESMRSEVHYNSFQRQQQQGENPSQPKWKQIILGRFGNSESQIMEYSQLPMDTLNSIPDTFASPGYYFFNATSFEEQRSTAQFLGKQRIASYSYMNLFAVFDWPHNKMQLSQIEKWAPQSGYIHSLTMYPPCLPFKKVHTTLTNGTAVPPWTSMIENKVVLVIHPFIDTIRHQMTKIQTVWSNVHDDVVPGAPYSCFPNVLEMKYIRTPLPVDHPTISWWESFENLKEDIRNVGYFDIALLGCGGYGMPLMTYISTLDFAPSAMYVGGSLQLFFGIHGARWALNDPSYFVWKPYYNDAWTWPLSSDIDNTTVGSIEGSAYVQPK